MTACCGPAVLPGDEPSGTMQFQPGTGATQTSGKLEWPEFVGQDGNTAKEAIEKEGYTAFLVPDGSMMTMDYRSAVAGVKNVLLRGGSVASGQRMSRLDPNHA